jgi:hypothetical protein
MNTTTTVQPPLERARHRADPLADATIARVLGPWRPLPAEATPADAQADHAAHWQRLTAVSRLLGQWRHNRDVSDWPPQGADVPAELLGPLQDYLRAAHALPDWADPQRLRRAEAIFMEYGPASCLLLFCASLPECYVLPDLAAVLQVAGQLEQHTEHRIRATAAMIFPVMMKGGLSDAQGSGVAQVLKVRLIHATIRNLILRGSPAQTSGLADVPPLPLPQAGGNLHRALFAHGWKPAEGMPCNQEELAYTLLTFGYVFLRGLRTLGLRLPREDEEAFLHAWNVVGHVLGIERALMATTMKEAASLFAVLQARGRARAAGAPQTPDPRAALAGALVRTLEQAIPLRWARAFPVLMTQHLCGRSTARDLGLAPRIAWPSRLAFAIVMGLARGIDAALRRVSPGLCLSRLFTRVLGYHVIVRLLMDETRPLALPEHLIGRVQGLAQGWRHDPRAPQWMNALARRLTGRKGLASGVPA